MADLNTVEALVEAVDAQIAIGTAGASIEPGDQIYIDTSDDAKLKAAVNSSAAAAKSAGLALNYASSGNQVAYAIDGEVDPGVTAVEGIVYCVSANAGKIAPFGDLITGDRLVILGVGNSSGNIDIDIKDTGATVQ